MSTANPLWIIHGLYKHRHGHFISISDETYLYPATPCSLHVGNEMTEIAKKMAQLLIFNFLKSANYSTVYYEADVGGQEHQKSESPGQLCFVIVRTARQ